MFGEPHDIPHEFPEYKDRIRALFDGNAEFKGIYTEYHELNAEILKIEQNLETTSDNYTETLKKKRVVLKDKIYALLREHPAG